ARKLLRGRGGRSPSLETVRRWASPRRGSRPAGPNGPRLVLRAIRLGGELLMLPEWVEEFERERRRLGVRTPAPGAPRDRTDRQRRRAYERAEAELDRRGCGTRGGNANGRHA